MPTKKELIEENIFLKKKLEEAMKWMRRQIEESRLIVAKDEIKKANKILRIEYLDTEQVNIITRNIETYFEWLKLPKYAKERIIDAELHWYQLQKYPKMDGSAVLISYQKIFDDIIESSIGIPFKKYLQQNRNNISERTNKNVLNLIKKDYTLSFSRLYNILIDSSNENAVKSENECVIFLKENSPSIFQLLHNKEFMNSYKQLMILEVFWKKRHSEKISYSETKFARSLIIGDFQNKKIGMLYNLIQSIQ